MKYLVILGLMATLLTSCGSTPNTASAPTTVAPIATTIPTDVPIPTIAATATSMPTDVPIPTVAPVTPTEKATTARQSGGLGLTRAEWETQHGAGVENPGLGYIYDKKQYIVAYQSDPAGTETVWYIEQRFDAPGVVIDDARKLSALILPIDSGLTKTYTLATGQLVDLSRSEWLKGRFPETTKIGKIVLPMWPEGEPGDFTIGYRMEADKVTSIVIGIGNNP